MAPPLPSSTPDPVQALTSLYEKLEAEKAKTGSYDKIFIRQVGDSVDNIQKNIQFEKKNWFSKFLIFIQKGGRKKEQYDVEKIANTFNTAFGKIDKTQLNDTDREKLINLQAHLNKIFKHKTPHKDPLNHDFGTQVAPTTGAGASPTASTAPLPPSPPPLPDAGLRKRPSHSRIQPDTASSTLTPPEGHKRRPPPDTHGQIGQNAALQAALEKRGKAPAHESAESTVTPTPSQQKSLLDHVQQLSLKGTDSKSKFNNLIDNPLFENAPNNREACLAILEKLFSDDQKVQIFGSKEPENFTFDDQNIEKFVQAVEGEKLPTFKKERLQNFIKVFNSTYTLSITKTAHTSAPMTQQTLQHKAGFGVSAEELQKTHEGLGGRRGRSQAKEDAPASRQKAPAEKAQDVTFDAKSVTQKQKFAELMNMPIFEKTLKDNNKTEALILFGKVFDLPDVTDNRVKSTATDEWKGLLRLSNDQLAKLNDLIRVATG